MTIGFPEPSAGKLWSLEAGTTLVVCMREPAAGKAPVPFLPQMPGLLNVLSRGQALLGDKKRSDVRNKRPMRLGG